MDARDSIRPFVRFAYPDYFVAASPLAPPPLARVDDKASLGESLDCFLDLFSRKSRFRALRIWACYHAKFFHCVAS